MFFSVFYFLILSKPQTCSVPQYVESNRANHQDPHDKGPSNELLLSAVFRRRLGLTNRQFVCQGLTLAFAPRSIAKRRSADGNLSFMVLIRLSGFLAFLSSSSKANK